MTIPARINAFNHSFPKSFDYGTLFQKKKSTPLTYVNVLTYSVYDYYTYI